ncbi:MAG: DUF2752 domain-containing protein [Allomuricauda sp.]|nr:MAG: DUF2752 domain-containing protein [Allomuricauda sp.]
MGLQDYMIPCATKQILGFDCPGCGLQRSALLLLKGDFIGAFYMHPAIYPITLALLFVLFEFFVKTKYNMKIRMYILISIGLTMIVNYLVKMSQFF